MSNGNHHGARPRLEVLRGGRDDCRDDALSEDWQAFCRRIGWQQLTEPQLPDDYEERLAERIFGQQDNQLVSLDAERARRWGLPLASAQTEEHDDVEPQRRRLPWLAAVALFAIAAIGAAALAWHRSGGAPSANTVPTPVPEMTLRPVAPPPPTDAEEKAPRPDPDTSPPLPDPGLRHAQRGPLVPKRARHRQAAIEAAATRKAPLAGDNDVPTGSAISPDAEPGAHPAAGGTQRTMVAVALAEAWHLDATRVASRHAPVVPSWHHLAVAAPHRATHARPTALVDLVEAGRRLSEQL